MQLTIDIPDEQAVKLDELSARTSASRDALVSEALNTYLQDGAPELGHAVEPLPQTPDPEETTRAVLSFFGALPHLEDGLVFQDRMRSEWGGEGTPERDPNLHG